MICNYGVYSDKHNANADRISDIPLLNQIETLDIYNKNFDVKNSPVKCTTFWTKTTPKDHT